jgi:predicted N-acetyltransferase YhbS
MCAVASQRKTNQAITLGSSVAGQMQGGHLAEQRSLRREPFVIEPARSGDHLAIHYFLQQVFGGPSPRDFQWQLEEPGYTPAQRLIVREGNRIIAHIRLVPGSMPLAGGTLPVARLCEMGVAPEYRGQGWGSELLQTAGRIALQRGYCLLVGRSDKADLFAQNHWFPCGMHTYSFADPREILAELDRRRPLAPPLPIETSRLSPDQIRVRRWKQTEYNALRRIYQQTFSSYPGPLARTDAQWRWLVQREAYDYLHVAVVGKERIVLDDIQSHVLGYTFVKGNRILELGAAHDQPEVQQALLTRVCRDAIELGITPVRFDAPSDHPLHALIHAAGGQSIHRACEGGQWRLAKVLDWPRMAKVLFSASHISSPLVIETHAQQAPSQRFIVERGKTICEHAALHTMEQPADVVCSEALLAQLWLGHGSLTEAINRMWIQFANPPAEFAFRSCLPERPLWLPALEELLA